MSGIRPIAIWLLLLFAKGTTAQINIALNKSASCSSVEGGYTATAAFDGQGTGLQISNSGNCSGTCTRWSSGFSDPQWLCVNLGAFYTISSIKLYWEVANGKDFKIQISEDSVTWKTVQTETGNKVFSNSYPINNVFGKYVRMYGTARNTVYGFSLWEMEVYGNFIVLPLKLSSFTAASNPSGVALSWKTYADAPTTFTVERSNDGYHFLPIGLAEAASGSNEGHFVDASLISNKNYYRLKWREKGSSITSYSEIVTVNTIEKFTVSIFPNPVTNGIINGILSQPYSGQLVTKLYNASGILMGQEVLYLNNSTRFTTHVKAAPPKGVYWLDAIQNESVVHQKIVIE